MDDGIYIDYLNRLVRKKVQEMLNKELTTFKHHQDNLLQILYDVSCEYLNFTLDRELFNKDAYRYLYKIYYNDSSDFQKLITVLDKILREIELFSHIYNKYVKINDICILREFSFFIDEYHSYENIVNNYIRVHKIKKILNNELP